MALDIIEMAEMATELKCSERVVVDLLDKKVIRGKKVGNKWKVLRASFIEDVEKYLRGKE